MCEYIYLKAEYHSNRLTSSRTSSDFDFQGENICKCGNEAHRREAAQLGCPKPGTMSVQRGE